MPRRLTLPVAAVTAAVASAALTGAALPGAPAADSGHGPWQARLLGEHVVGKDVVVGGTTVGELSSIDYDRATGTYYLVADDTEEAPAHFYTLRMRVDGAGVRDVRFTDVRWILRKDGTAFPPLSSDGTELADPEGMRLDPATRTLYWSSEGKRVAPRTKPVVPRKPVVSRTKPVVSRAKPVVSRAKPVVSRAKPVVSRTKPVVSRTKPVVSRRASVVSRRASVVPRRASVVPRRASVVPRTKPPALGGESRPPHTSNPAPAGNLWTTPVVPRTASVVPRTKPVVARTKPPALGGESRPPHASNPAPAGDLWTTPVVHADGEAQLVDPWVRQVTLSGRHVRELGLPGNQRMSAAERGPRGNLVFEGLTLSADGRQLVASNEGALHQDGPIATVEHGAVNRVTWWDKRTGRAVRQVAYPLSPIPEAPVPPTAAADNGVSELLAVDDDRFLAVERSYASGVGNTVRVFEIDAKDATNVLHKRSLTGGDYRPVRKRLVLDLGELGLDHVDNIEGVTWGPRLPTGERTLVFVSDDNYNGPQVTQLVAVAVRPAG